MFDRLILCWRIVWRRCLAMLGMGRTKKHEESLLPVHAKAAADAARERVELGAGGPSAANESSWDDWGDEETREFEQTGFKSRKEKQEEAISSLFEEMAPKKIKAKKVKAKTLLDDARDSGGSGRSRLRLAVDPGMAAGADLGDLDDGDGVGADDTWGADDDIDLADVKAVERAAAKRAHEKAVEERRAARRAAREAAHGRPQR